VTVTVFAVAAGLVLQAWVGYQARHGGTAPGALFWLSLLLLYLPIAWRVLTPGLSRRGQAALTLLLGEALLASRAMLYPSAFVYHDEIIHRNTLRLIEENHHLFTPNSLLPVSPYYPGLELATDAVHQVTGLSNHLSGVLVLLLGRAVMMLALFRIVELVSRSPAVAGAAALVYAANPQFLMFNAQFSYQSLALPLALLTGYLFATRGSGCLLPAAAAAAATAVTHHLTSIAMLAVLAGWCGVSRLRWCARVPGLGRLTLVTLVVVAGWTAVAGPRILPYLSELGTRTVTAVRALTRGGSDHAMFSDAAGTSAPVWERAISLAAVLLICLCLPMAVVSLRRWFPKGSAAAVVLVAAGLAYPLIPAGHLTIATAEVAERSAGFLFVGLGFVLAAWQAHRPVRPLVATAAVGVVFAGGTVLGSGPDWLRTPGGYLVEAENRSVDTDNVATARWLRDHVAPGGRVFTDRVNGLLAAAVGRQHTLTNLADGVDLAEAAGLLLDGPRGSDVRVVAANRIDYLIADRRLAASLPHVGVYIDDGEPDASHHKAAPPEAALTKFDAVPGAERIYDNGSDRVYDLRRLR
jgi:hypothetical protein